MKKLLLASLFVIGATSFAGVEGTTNNVQLPIRLKGNLVTAASENLMIEGTTTGMAGNIMDFNFGDIQIPTASTDPTATAGDVVLPSQVLTGTFRLWRPKGGDIAKAQDNIKIGFNDVGELGAIEGVNIATGLDINIGLSKTYINNASLTGIKEVEGVVTAQMVVHDNAAPGTFFHGSERLYVVIN